MLNTSIPACVSSHYAELKSSTLWVMADKINGYFILFSLYIQMCPLHRQLWSANNVNSQTAVRARLILFLHSSFQRGPCSPNSPWTRWCWQTTQWTSSARSTETPLPLSGGAERKASCLGAGTSAVAAHSEVPWLRRNPHCPGVTQALVARLTDNRTATFRQQPCACAVQSEGRKQGVTKDFLSGWILLMWIIESYKYTYSRSQKRRRRHEFLV